MSKRILTVAVPLLMIQLVTGGCAALFNHNGGDVQVNSNPSGARVFVDGVDHGLTPVKLQLDEKKDHIVMLKSGNKERAFTLQKKLGASWVVLDVLGGLLPVVIDGATGSWYDLEPHELNAQLD